MSVIIKDMDMPVDCLGCRIILCDRESYLKSGRPKGCPLIEVVHCKDCRWWNEDDFPRAFPEKKTSACECPNIYGANFSRYTQEDEFCSRGVRREDAT